MKRALIITPYGLNNYGNRLQNYAMSELLRERGFSCNTLEFLPMLGGTKTYRELAKRLVWNKFNGSIRAKRMRAFLEFDEAIPKERILSRLRLRSLKDEYDLFVIGSDQIWNPYHIYDEEFQFATFAATKKRIAYAPSFGISELPDFCKPSFKEGLQTIDCLSVRERTGRHLIYDLTGKEIPVVLDPTLLLERDRWDKVASGRMVPSEKYAFVYFIGPNCDEQRRAVRAFCDKRSLAFVEVMNLRESRYYSAGPQDFVGLLKQSSAVFTNSFHAAVFSLMYERPLKVYRRISSNGPSMGSRLDDFACTFGLGDCIGDLVSAIDEMSFDYRDALCTLERERVLSGAYIDRAVRL